MRCVNACKGRYSSWIKFLSPTRAPSCAACACWGRRLGDLLLAAGLPQPASDDQFLEEAGVSVLRQERFDLPGYELIGALETLDALQERLTSAGAVPLADSVSYEARRIELGRPRPGQELTDAFTPLETGMVWVCAENKGCYTGQEIIARQLTYDKVTRSLVRLRSELPLAEGAAVSVNDSRRRHSHQQRLQPAGRAGGARSAETAPQCRRR